MDDQLDLILVTQSNVVDYEGFGNLPLDRSDLYKHLVYPRMVLHEGRFRSHLDYINRRVHGRYFDQGTMAQRREMLNIWNLPSMAGVHLINYLAQFGYRVRVINNLDSEWDWFEEAYRNCRRPPLVGISSTFYLSWKEVGGVAKRLRALDPEMDIVLGGAFANAETINGDPAAFAQRMRRYGIRYVLHAFNSETDLRDLLAARRGKAAIDAVRNLARIDGKLAGGSFELGPKVWNEPLLSLKDCPPTWDQHHLPFLNRTIQIRTASGCPFACAFCSYPTTAGPWQTVEADHVRAHLDSLMRIGTIDRIIFIDDTFNVPPHRFRELIKIFAEYRFEWFSFLRVQYVDDEVVRMMKDSGCKGVYLGIESASDKVLRNMNKRATSRQFAEGVQLLNKHDIDYLAAFVLGFPGEDDGTIQENIDFIRDNGVRFYSLKEFYYMPHTLVHEKRAEYGLTGMGNKWSHATMSHEQASRIKLEMFQAIESTHIDPDTSLWYMAYLYDQGYDFGQIRQWQAEINALMKRQLAAGNLAALPEAAEFTQAAE
ncbi:radical SAM protein [Roseomonas stagni]|uniref:Radical SAM protein n=1 Tax=Falsiroseomonas algicola TaxID=2716930 RepID=A0A6M1LJ20_9PROT|nr:radical SAM protein [Falsiroseomonas algicola]NGM19904.1 radical SAM protein [Falsiroseomonas algicola]